MAFTQTHTLWAHTHTDYMCNNTPEAGIPPLVWRMCQTSLNSVWERSGILTGKGSMSPVTRVLAIMFLNLTHFHPLTLEEKQPGKKNLIKPWMYADILRHLSFKKQCLTVWWSCSTSHLLTDFEAVSKLKVWVVECFSFIYLASAALLKVLQRDLQPNNHTHRHSATQPQNEDMIYLT